MIKDDRAFESVRYSKWKGWGEFGQFGHLSPGESQYFGKELRDIRRHGRPIHDVLEVGFGNGAFLSYCRERGWNVSGTELGPDLVGAGREAGFNVFPADELATVPDKSVDLIAAFDVLEHIPSEAIVSFLTEMSTKLRDGGMMIFRFPNADSWLGNAMQNGDPTHVTAIGYLKMTYFALQANLDVVRFRGVTRHGFATSVVNGVYSLVAGPVIAVIALLKRMLYFPGLPVVLSTSNVICVVRRREQVQQDL
ncbi:MAG: class I SAM-dependent methyltransferase [Terrimesophilobacter sp.]